MDIIIQILFMGIFATIAIDLWATFSQKVLKTPKTDWAMVGRWLGHIPRGALTHSTIADAPPVINERLLGWLFHYVIGVAYALLYMMLVELLCDAVPELLSAWVFGLVTVLAPWFILQPGLGVGICATKAPKPNLVRLQNLVIHSIFGVSLYCAWLITESIL